VAIKECQRDCKCAYDPGPGGAKACCAALQAELALKREEALYRLFLCFEILPQ